jgi:hypothetical protein
VLVGTEAGELMLGKGGGAAVVVEVELGRMEGCGSVSTLVSRLIGDGYSGW